MRTAKFILILMSTAAAAFLVSTSLASDFTLTINNNTDNPFKLYSSPSLQFKGTLLPKEHGKGVQLELMGPDQKFALLLTDTNTGNKASVIYRLIDGKPMIQCNPQTISYHCRFSAVRVDSATVDLDY